MAARLVPLALFVVLLVVPSLAGKPAPVAKSEPAPVHYIDLLPNANMKLGEALGTGLDGNNLEELLTGEQTLARKAFKIEDGLIHLSGAKVKNKPASVLGIKVNRRFIKLNIFQGTAFGSTGEEGDPFFVPDGTLIGEYRIQYDDRSTTRIPILYGRDVRDWWDQDKSKPVTRGVLAWQGTNRKSKQAGEKIRLYVTTWENPQPRKLVTHIDYHSANTACSPFCIAMTAEGDGLKASGPNFYHDFRNRNFSEQDLKMTGAGADRLVRPEAEGLRITLPADREGSGQVGVVTRFRITGDFEITTAYEILRADQPKTPRGVGFEIFLATDSPNDEAASFYREVHAGGEETFMGVRMTTIQPGVRGPTPGSAFEPVAASGRSGQMRLTRKGSKLTYAVAGPADKDFRQLYEAELGVEDVTQLRLAASSGGPNAVDVRVLDLRVRTVSGK